MRNQFNAIENVYNKQNKNFVQKKRLTIFVYFGVKGLHQGSPHTVTKLITIWQMKHKILFFHFVYFGGNFNRQFDIKK